MHLKIGDFARLSRASIKTLRYYDEIGLLKPAHVDAFTNYRYYDARQLAVIHRIMALKDLNLSLAQIRVMLESDLSTEQLQGMLDLKQAELEQDVREAQSRLAQVQFRLRMLRGEDDLPNIDIQCAEVPSMTGLTEHLSMKRHAGLIMSDQMAARGKLYQEAFSCFEVPQKPPISILFDFDPNATEWRSQSVMPVDEAPEVDFALSDGTSLTYETIPGLRQAAAYLFEGPYEQIMEQAIVVERWMVENDYERGQQTRVIYHRGPMHFEPQTEFVTEIQIEIAPKST